MKEKKIPKLNMKAVGLVGDLQVEYDSELHQDIEKCVEHIKMLKQFNRVEPKLDIDLMLNMKIIITKKEKSLFSMMFEKVDFDKIDASFKKEEIY